MCASQHKRGGGGKHGKTFFKLLVPELLIWESIYYVHYAHVSLSNIHMFKIRQILMRSIQRHAHYAIEIIDQENTLNRRRRVHY